MEEHKECCMGGEGAGMMMRHQGCKKIFVFILAVIVAFVFVKAPYVSGWISSSDIAFVLDDDIKQIIRPSTSPPSPPLLKERVRVRSFYETYVKPRNGL